MWRAAIFSAFIAILAIGALVKSDSVTTLRADDFYPLPFSPDATVLVGDVQIGPDGSVAGLHVFEYAGSAIDCTDHTLNGVCCACNVTRGDTPECGFIVRNTDSTISTDCTQTWPAGHFGSNSGAFLDRVTVSDGHASHHKRMRHKHRRSE